MPPQDKPYKILVRSPKGCAFDRLLCVKCCETIQRSNYSRHKISPKHTKLHDGGSDEEREDPEIYRNRQIEKVIKYHENRNNAMLEELGEQLRITTRTELKQKQNKQPETPEEDEIYEKTPKLTALFNYYANLY